MIIQILVFFIKKKSYVWLKNDNIVMTVENQSFLLITQIICLVPSLFLKSGKSDTSEIFYECFQSYCYCYFLFIMELQNGWMGKNQTIKQTFFQINIFRVSWKQADWINIIKWLCFQTDLDVNIFYGFSWY